ncbi:sensor histidine kinase [Sphingomonas sp. BK345]|uniref:sensor histidine kinase n=1 Tax=Sphingomonas sp. BK345 TaxID=2586980 RepID=UPI0016160AC4|nr:sensor histidine kinase [Sphingomonas sp. BK345]MBB3475734.1 signal transduction histidine kinase/ligand-binding sensor domain-containing protein [Sphingomonas sp. BK345]
MLLLNIPFFAAASPPLPFLQTSHLAWRSEDNAPGGIEGLAQTPDGFLWLATGTGLYRFDGLSFERFTVPEEGLPSPSLQVSSIAAAPNGDVWIGYANGGIARYRGGRLQRLNPGKPSPRAVYLTVTPDGALWARVGGSEGSRIVRYALGRWEHVGSRWNLPSTLSTVAMLVTRDGALYLLSTDGLRHLPRGGRRFSFQPLNPGDGATIAEDRRGRIWLANDSRLSRVEMGKGFVGPPTPLERANYTSVYRRLAFSRDGMLWLGGSEDGIRVLAPDAGGDQFRRVPGRYTADDGLSSSITLSMLRDREDNIWVGTVAGLDRFATSRSVKRSDLPQSYTVDSLVTARATYLLSGNNVYRSESTSLRRLAALANASTICGDRDTGLVVGTAAGLFNLAGGRARPFRSPPGLGTNARYVMACAVGVDGTLLVSIVNGGLWRHDKAGWRAIPVSTFQDLSALLFVRSADGTTYVVFKPDRIGVVRDNGIMPLEAEGEAAGYIRTVAAGKKCTFFGGQNGLFCLTGRRMRALRSSAYPELLNVSGVVEAQDGWTWLSSNAGLLRISTRDLAGAFAAPGQPLHFERFGTEQGLRGDPNGFVSRSMAPDRYGRLWAFTTKGLVSIDMGRADASTMPPRAVVTNLLAGGRRFALDGTAKLPVGTRSIEIDYTATSLTDPRGTRFSYRLEGQDSAWIDAGPRREAIYTNLRPGRYVFHLRALNSAGLPSRRAESLAFVIRPGILERHDIRVAMMLMLVVALIVAYRWRVQTLSTRFAERMQERLGERERIARELHDTLLQGFQGLLLRFQSIANRMPANVPLGEELEEALGRGEAVLVEGRNRVRDLRSDAGNLSEALTDVAQQMSIDWPGSFTLTTEGHSRTLNPVAAQELRSIGEEAIRNAFRHAEARSIKAVLTYRQRELRFALRDDGVGLPSAVQADGLRDGHYGLIGMRERATKIGGTLTITSRLGAYTEVIATVPGTVAYAPITQPRRRWIVSRFRRKS